MVDRAQVFELAHAAAAAHSWDEAFEAFRSVDAEGELSADDLEGLAYAAYFSGHATEAVDAAQRMYAVHENAGRTADAGSAAVSTALLHFAHGDASAGSGWLSCGQRLLVDVPES